MIKIKSDINQKLLKNFSNQTFPDITILTATSKYSLTLAFLVIDSEYFNSLPADTIEVDLSYLPEKPLVQVLRALYGDQLVVYSISQLEMMYRVIDVLKIQEYRNAVVAQILKNKDLMENLQILEFCTKNGLVVKQIKKIHIEHNLRALESNKNFLQLNKISLQTLIPLLLEYYQQVEQQGGSVINNILQNYFNRNNIRPLQFFEKYDDVQILLNIWQQFHHILHIQRRQHLQKIMMNPVQQQRMPDTKRITSDKSEHDSVKIKQKDMRIEALQAQIQSQNRVIQKLRKQLFSLKAQGGKIYSAKRIPSNPVLPYDEQDEISIIQSNKLARKDLALKNVRSEYVPGPVKGGETKNFGRIMISHKSNFTDL